MVQATLKQFRAAPALFSIAPRLDLRTGAVAAGVTDIDARAVSDDWVALMRDARAAWISGGYTAPLSCAAPMASLRDGSSASDLDAALREAGYPMRGATLEVHEADIVAASGAPLQALERLRARGWGVMLRCAPECPLPFGGKTRSIFTDVRADAPADLTPFLGLDGYDDNALARRIAASANAGLNVTANNLHTMAHAGLLVASGFDRGQGPGLRMKALV